MNQHYNDLLYRDKRFVINNDSFNTDICEELRMDSGFFNQIVSAIIFVIWEILF